MGIFKRWFSKQDRNYSPDFEELKNILDENSLEEDTLDEDSSGIPQTDVLAYIFIAANKEGENFVACNFDQDQQTKMAELIFLLGSGALVEDCAKALMQVCEDKEEYEMILRQASMFFQLYKQQEVARQRAQSGPVVDPCEVFSKRDRNEFKG